MEIITASITLEELKRIACEIFGNSVKAVVDTEKNLIALDAELHSDLEAMLLNDGSKQKDVWGINLYPELQGEDFIEFDSMINLRPSQGNTSLGVENEETRKKIIAIVSNKIKR